MTAYSEQFPWPSYYGNFNYFEHQMNVHSAVVCLTADGAGVYELDRKRGDTLRVFICECYAFGVAEYFETVENIGSVDVVIINSTWCGYTPDAKAQCRESSVGLFTLKEFMGALHLADYWRYLTEEEKKHLKKRGCP